MAKVADKTYGQALFDLGLEEDCLDVYASQAAVICALFRAHPEFIKLLNHPGISKEEKISVIENCFKGKVDDALTGFMIIVVKAGRQSALESIFGYFTDSVKTYKHIGKAYVTSAAVLTDAQKAAVEERLLQLTGNISYEIFYNVDPSLIGGMNIRVGDQVADSSIKTQLKAISGKLLDIQVGD